MHTKAEGCVRGRKGSHPLRLLLVLILALGLVGFCSASTQIQQGASGSFTATGTSAPSFGQGWQILNPSGTQVGSNSTPNGWSVTYNTSGNSLTVTVPSAASLGTGYAVKYLNLSIYPIAPHSGLFDVISGGGNNPPDAPTNLTAIGSNGLVALSWSASATATSYKIQRALSSGGTASTVATGITTTTYNDTAVTNGTTYYYQVVAVNQYGDSPLSNEASVVPQNTDANFEVIGIHETRAHSVTVDAVIKNAAPYTSNSSSQNNGVTYYTTTAVSYYFCTDLTLQDGLVIPQGSLTKDFSLQFPAQGPGTTYSMRGYQVSSSQQKYTFSSTSTGGAARAFLVREVSGTTYHYANGVRVDDSATVFDLIKQIEGYNVMRLNADAVSIDSRRTYGQPNLDGELPGDPNADLRNPSFYGWTYKGGLFAGNVPSGTGDLSGTARIQAYITTNPTFVDPIWSAFTCIYLGVGGSFTNIPTYTLSVPAADDPNLNVAAGIANWGNAWNLATASPRSDLTVDNALPIGEYGCFQNPGYSAQMIIHLKNEAAAISGNIPYWRYFANLGYATASGLITASDAQPRLWVVDRVLSGVDPS